ncbi:hypothetical protein OIU76_003476 [Salix suchowensis]|nr:hypothetical protein OIU76_003476 [Salix suchowensis]
MGVKVVVLPVVGMIMAECAQAGRMIAGKAAMSDGLSSFVFVLYSHTIASIILLPSSLIFNRQQERPPLTLSIVSGFFLLGLFGCLGQSFGYAGINLSSPELGTAMLNTVPGLTFVLAVIFRMERVDCRSYSTLAKSMGTIVSMGGAFIVTFYKGPLVLEALPSASDSSHQVLSQDSNWVLGGLLLAADCAMASSWLIVQASILKKYSAKSVVVFFYFFFSTILSLIVSLVMVRDPSAWSLKSKTRLISVLFSGILGHAFQVGVTTWCLQKTGPLFVSIFAPLGIVITATVSVIFFGDALNLGILIGAVVIASGFYAVIWGKSQEAIKKVDDEENSGPASSSQKAMISANTCTLTSPRLFKKYTNGNKRNLKLFTVRASSDDTECNTEECAPEKEVGKVSMEWLAGEKTKVVGTFPPSKRGWTGYVEKDTAGQTNIYSVEPAVYVAESAISSGSAVPSQTEPPSSIQADSSMPEIPEIQVQSAPDVSEVPVQSQSEPEPLTSSVSSASLAN